MRAQEAITLRNVHPDDAPAICEIYNHYILESPATFEEIPIAPDEMRQRILETTRAFPWFVCEEDGRLLGYSHARKWRERAAYRHSAEASVYLRPTAVGKGRGSALLEALLTELRARQIHCVIGGIALPNEASVALLEKFSFRQVAHFKETGYKFGNWIDVGYWQLML
jgi:phosphinothricin acetyltransferase